MHACKHSESTKWLIHIHIYTCSMYIQSIYIYTYICMAITKSLLGGMAYLAHEFYLPTYPSD